MIKLIIFDLDGTLIDAYGAIGKSLNFVLKNLGYKKASLYQVKINVGLGDKNFVSRFVDGKEVTKALALYRGHHRDALLRYSRVKPMVRKTLSVLRRQGIKLAVASNRPTKFSHILLKHLDLEKYFDVIACADKKHELKPEPYLLLKVIRKLKADKDKVLYVGDMAYDIKAGRNAKVKPIAIIGGSCSRKELAALKPYKIISKLNALLKLIKR
ncbi:MAG: HAD family hydrolase [Elusimicrobia bacterium]|nr:HAD family hydrolase [Elusimicrobiota bacterium]